MFFCDKSNYEKISNYKFDRRLKVRYIFTVKKLGLRIFKSFVFLNSRDNPYFIVLWKHRHVIQQFAAKQLTANYINYLSQWDTCFLEFEAQGIRRLLHFVAYFVNF